MTAARLSPTANLLRNSKLFALPPALSLPPARPTAEPTTDSDTATTIYPIKAALETPPSSLSAGDWGLKRALPLHSTTNTSTPTIRLRKDIDTEAHVADFESAADHVVTLNKWQNVNPQIVNTPKWGITKSSDRRVFSVFHHNLDNTTARHTNTTNASSQAITGQLAPQVPEHLKQALVQLRADQQAKYEKEGIAPPPPREQPPAPPVGVKRWRYKGPWLAGMSNLEFDTFLKSVTDETMLGKWDDFLLEREVDLRYADTGRWDPDILNERSIPELKTLEEQQGTRPLGEERGVASRMEAHEDAAGEESTMLSSQPEDVESAKDALPPPKDWPRPQTREQRVSAIRSSLDPQIFQQRVQEIKKKLRSDREAFASAIADFLDLPDGPARPSLMIGRTEGGDWGYARNTAATQHYKEVGPPRTHPSAGFSYVRSTQFARNDPKIGPAYPTDVLPARLLRDSMPQDANGDRRLEQSIGVGGFVGRQERFGTRSIIGGDQWRPVTGGPKLVVKLLETTVRQDGAIEVGVVRDKEYELNEENVPYNRQDWEREIRAQRRMPNVSDRLEQLDQSSTRRRQYRKAEPLNKQPDEDVSEIMAALNASLRRGEK